MYTNFSTKPAVGCLLGIQISPQRGAAMQALTQAAVETARGLCGDRFFTGKRPLTLLTEYELQKLAFDTGLPLTFADVRRNLLIRGLTSTSLLGQRFWIGTIPFEATAPCPPCAHLQQHLEATYTSTPDLHSFTGGIVIRPLARGVLQVGDMLCL